MDTNAQTYELVADWVANDPQGMSPLAESGEEEA